MWCEVGESLRLRVCYTQLTEFLVMKIDSLMFYFTSSATIRQLQKKVDIRKGLINKIKWVTNEHIGEIIQS